MKNNIEISKILNSLRENIVKILLISFFSGIIFLAVSKFLITPVYQSSVTMIINNTNENNFENTTDQMNELKLNQQLVNTYSELVKSRGVSKDVIDTLELDIKYDEFTKMVSVQPVKDTEILEIKVNDTVKDRAVDIANQTALVFKDAVKNIFKYDNVQILDQAIIPEEPIFPNTKKISFIGLLIGFSISTISIVMIDIFDTKIKSAEDVKEAFDIPVLGQVPDKKKVD